MLKRYGFVPSGMRSNGRCTMTGRFKKPCILIADDSHDIRELIKAFYEHCDFEFIEAANGLEAVENARLKTPDLILMDIVMPVMNGCDAAVILKNDKALSTIPIVFITGQAIGAWTEQIKGMYAEFLKKPFTQADLLKVTMQCLAVEL